jgi:nicotinamidase/pyrazinamidase
MEALIVVDAQNDFFEEGNLPVRNSNFIINNINSLLPLFKLVIFTQDWHPEDHCSFQIWPKHCIQNTIGAEIHPDINFKLIKGEYTFVKKGSKKDIENYSAFDENQKNGLKSILRLNKVEEVFVCGLAGDYCVKETINDSLKYGFITNLVIDAIAFINEESKNKVLEELKKKNVWILETEKIQSFLDY